jgi:UDP-2,3-diacylglucosamine pyrophosphatase LpxH
MTRRCLIIIADAHVQEDHDEAEFFAMLSALQSHTTDVVFLGDIFELWIGFDRYEKSHHRRFLQWCANELPQREIGFVEGNHEFFVARNHGESFTWWSEDSFAHPELPVCFAHGDKVNRKDLPYLRFRRLARSRPMRLLVRILPWGRSWVDWLRRKLKKTNAAFRGALPREEIQRAWQESPRPILALGHFHQPFSLRAGQNQVWVCPAWLENHQVTLLRQEKQGWQFQSLPWREALGKLPRRAHSGATFAAAEEKPERV